MGNSGETNIIAVVLLGNPAFYIPGISVLSPWGIGQIAWSSVPSISSLTA